MISIGVVRTGATGIATTGTVTAIRIIEGSTIGGSIGPTSDTTIGIDTTTIGIGITTGICGTAIGVVIDAGLGVLV